MMTRIKISPMVVESGWEARAECRDGLMRGFKSLPCNTVAGGNDVVLVDKRPTTTTRTDLDVGLRGTGRSGEGGGGEGSAKNKLRKNLVVWSGAGNERIVTEGLSTVQLVMYELYISLPLNIVS